MTERSKGLELATRNFLQWHNIEFIRIEYRCFACGAIHNKDAADFPDYYCYEIDVFLECKTGKGKQTKGQRAFRDAVVARGARHIEVRDTIDELLKWKATWGGRSPTAKE